ncbi:MAG: GNAT family N-acetyltransferase [Alsobacter sp.]
MRLPFLTPAVSSIRPLQVRDAAVVGDLHAAGFAHPWAVHEIEALLVDAAVVGQGIGPAAGTLFGFVLSRCAADEAEILSIVVDRRHRGAGLAGRLLRAHLGRLSARGIRQLFLEVDEGNAAARALYDRSGFAEVGRRPGYYRRPDGSVANALVLRRELD